jgi:Mrp family chromosome partitioning ATPase
MFDALRRAESERRKKQGSDSVESAPSFEPVPQRVSETSAPYVPAATPPRPVRAREPVPAPVQASPSPPDTAFPADMLRELGICAIRWKRNSRRKPAACLMFTSAMHGEGVTTLALALPRLLALHNDHACSWSSSTRAHRHWPLALALHTRGGCHTLLSECAGRSRRW